MSLPLWHPRPGCGSRQNNQGTADFSLYFHLPRLNFGYPFLTGSHLDHSPVSYFQARDTKPACAGPCHCSGSIAWANTRWGKELTASERDLPKQRPVIVVCKLIPVRTVCPERPSRQLLSVRLANRSKPPMKGQANRMLRVILVVYFLLSNRLNQPAWSEIERVLQERREVGTIEKYMFGMLLCHPLSTALHGRLPVVLQQMRFVPRPRVRFA